MKLNDLAFSTTGQILHRTANHILPHTHNKKLNDLAFLATSQVLHCLSEKKYLQGIAI